MDKQVAVQYVEDENGVQHEVQVVQHVVINQRIHTIQVMHVVMHVVGYVMSDIIRIVVIHVRCVRREINVHDELRHNVVVEHMQQHEVVVVQRQVHDTMRQHEHEVRQKRVHDTMQQREHVVRQHVEDENMQRHEAQVVVI